MSILSPEEWDEQWGDIEEESEDDEEEGKFFQVTKDNHEGHTMSFVNYVAIEVNN